MSGQFKDIRFCTAVRCPMGNFLLGRSLFLRFSQDTFDQVADFLHAFTEVDEL